MTSTGRVIERAYRESGLLEGRQNPTPTEAADGLEALQTLVSAAYGFDVGEALHDWPLGTAGMVTPALCQPDFTRPPANVRLIMASTSAQTVYLPANPDDGARIALIDPASRLSGANVTLDGNGRTIEAASTVTLSTNLTAKIWFYRADQGDWVLLAPLSAAAEFPFPPEFDDYFITRLAIRLSPRYERQLSPATIGQMEHSQTQLVARYAQVRRVGVDPGLVRMSRQTWDGGFSGWNPLR